jgi:TRAP transporter TAXI family solute receptor
MINRSGSGRLVYQRGQPRFLGPALVLILVLSAAFLSAAAPGIGGPKDTAPKTRLILATATTGGTYYPVGVAIATLTTRELERSLGISLTAISSAGSGENLQLLKNREADLAIIQSLFGVMARQGKGRYQDDPQTYLRSITILWDNFEHFTVRGRYVQSGDMTDMQDLRKKNFSIGRRGSGTEMSGRVILEALGFDPARDFKLQYLGYTPSAQSLQNGRIAGMNIPAGPPASAITQAVAAMGAEGVRILEFTDAQLAAVNAAYPVWRRAVIRAGTYPGQTENISTISQPNLLVVHEDIPDDVVYALVKNLFSHLDYLKRVHQATSVMSLDGAIDGLMLPLHPGAVRFYTEQGLEVPSSLR